MNINKFEAIKLLLNSTYENGNKIGNAFKSIFNKLNIKED